MTAFARPALTNFKEVEKYLKEDINTIPNLNGKKIVSLGKPQSIPEAKNRKGIGDIQVAKAKLAKGETAHLAIVNRKDGKGSYIFVYTAPGGKLENNDGYVEQIFNTLRALPQDKK